MIYNYAKTIMLKLNFSHEAISELLDLLNIFLKSDEFLKIIDCYSINCDFTKALNNTKELALKLGVSEYKSYMLLFICLSEQLKKSYKKYGISDEIFYNTISDLRYKLDECILVYNTIGTFVPMWYKGFFEMKIFALGRLQFEIKNIWFDCDINGVHIPKGTKVLSVHIPRSGTPLYHDLVIESYKRAQEFFKDKFDANIIFICDSWLLYPWNRTILKDNSNLAQFYDDFTIVNSGDYDNYNEVWRLFDCLYDGNVNNLPSDTSLRRAYIERIKNGLPIGHGTGVIVYNK